jgi:hypothetical protein
LPQNYITLAFSFITKDKKAIILATLFTLAFLLMHALRLQCWVHTKVCTFFTGAKCIFAITGGTIPNEFIKLKKLKGFWLPNLFNSQYHGTRKFYYCLLKDWWRLAI